MQQETLKRKVVHGAVNNLAFAAAGSILTYLQALFVMRMLGPEQIGIYAMAAVVAITVDFVSDFGIGDRLVQQDQGDLKHSYDCAVTIHFLAAVGLSIVVLSVAPLLARVYHQPALWPLISAMSYSAFGGFLRLPLWLLNRDLNYFQQRLLLFLGRVAGFLVTVGLALVGQGIWSLAIGGLATVLVTGIPAWWMCRYRPRWRFDLPEIKSLVGFSSPVWFSKLSYVVVQQGCIFVLSLSLSAQDVGQYKSAEQLASIVFYLEVVIGQTIFPVLCRLKNDPVKLGEAFSISTRITVAWVAAFSIGLYIFAGEIVQEVLSPKWAGAELFLKAQGIALLFGAIFFNWDSIFKARNLTRPIFDLSALFAGAFMVIFVPLAYFGGRQGAAIGLVIMSLLILVGRYYFLSRLKLGISLVDIAKRPIFSSAIAAGAVIVLRRESGLRAGWLAFAVEATLYGIVYSAILLWLERSLVAEGLRFLRSGKNVPMETAAAARNTR
jgi:O-antigen/teichoic acid export membrane protein